jgi:hypothetical protein
VIERTAAVKFAASSSGDVEILRSSASVNNMTIDTRSLSVASYPTRSGYPSDVYLSHIKTNSTGICTPASLLSPVSSSTAHFLPTSAPPPVMSLGRAMFTLASRGRPMVILAIIFLNGFGTTGLLGAFAFRLGDRN